MPKKPEEFPLPRLTRAQRERLEKSGRIAEDAFDCVVILGLGEGLPGGVWQNGALNRRRLIQLRKLFEDFLREVEKGLPRQDN